MWFAEKQKKERKDGGGVEAESESDRYRHNATDTARGYELWR